MLVWILRNGSHARIAQEAERQCGEVMARKARKGVQFHMFCTEKELAWWRACSGKRQLSNWVRDKLNKAVLGSGLFNGEVTKLPETDNGQADVYRRDRVGDREPGDSGATGPCVCEPERDEPSHPGNVEVLPPEDDRRQDEPAGPDEALGHVQPPVLEEVREVRVRPSFEGAGFD